MFSFGSAVGTGSAKYAAYYPLDFSCHYRSHSRHPFSAAYLAENVRGGLQSIPRGQHEAANALGLNTPLTLGLIVLPQALKVAIPAMVGQFISLVQDTTLLSIIGMFELLGISRSILANPQFIGRYSEVYIFIGCIYWLLCYALSLASRRLEKQLNTES
jgi:general L-amino acid transport system permease protein